MNSRIIYFGLILILILFSVYLSTKKERIYISFEELDEYEYQISDSSEIQDIKKIILNGTGKLNYQWWEIDIDNQKIKKSDIAKINKSIIHSQFFIIRNYAQDMTIKKDTEKYKLYIILWDMNTPYILPVISVKFLME